GADLPAILPGADLSGAFLPRADLSEATLWGADLSEADLQEADLSEADLWDADLSEATLPEADLSEAKLSDADLSEADLWDADLSGADLQRTDLSETWFREADLSGADLQEADLPEVDLWDANLSGADLQRTDLSEATLPDADLSEAILSDADLSGATLSDADLSKADLQDADLSEADLQRTDLSGAFLPRADLSEAALNDADLKEVEGLQVMQLRGGDVSLATLPDAVKRFAGLDTAKATTQSAKKLFISVLVACAYATLAIALKTGGAEDIELPIIGLDIGTQPFYLVTPALLALLFGYFHLQMQRLWEELAQLPAIFPDGKPLDEKVHPWLVTGLVRAHTKRLREKQSPPFFLLQRFVAVLLAWGSVPVTLVYFAGMYSPGSGTWSSFYLHILAALTTGGAVAAYRKATRTLELKKHHPIQFWSSDSPSEEEVKWFFKSLNFWIGTALLIIAVGVWYLRLPPS
uniref:pentapeptide repeat-containing protein n=1 Tax=Salinibacter ruber TaxID=146919 RepID=UPI0020746CCF